MTKDTYNVRQTATFEDVEVIRETEKAILCIIPEVGLEATWIPKSVLDEDSEVHGLEDAGALIIDRWFAIKEKWIEG